MRTGNSHQRPPSFDAPDAAFRMGTLFAEIWQDWLQTISQMAYQTHRACELLAENGGQPIAQLRPFGFAPSRGHSERTTGPIDIDRLRQCLQSMDPDQASQIVHAVQMMEATEAMLKGQQSRANDAEGAAW